MKTVFLDYNSTTPVRDEVLNAMLPYFAEEYGNPSTLYWLGQTALRALDNARLQTASLISANVDEIYFTSGGTESNNLAIAGIAQKHPRKHLITSAIEHSSVYNYCKKLESDGYNVTFLPVDTDGLVSLADLESAITDETFMITIMLANNETGVIQKVKLFAEIAARHKIFIHTDAIQAVGKIHVSVKDLGVDLLSISGHKIYGPKGGGALFVKRGISLAPILYGGGQERKLRSGTENVPAIVGLGKACELAKINLVENSKHLKPLRDSLENGIIENIPKAKVNGRGAERIPNTSNISFAGEESDALVVKLDLHGIAVSSGSACGSSASEPSRVLKAMRLPKNELNSSLRFSVGNSTTPADIEYTVATLKKRILK